MFGFGQSSSSPFGGGFGGFGQSQPGFGFGQSSAGGFGGFGGFGQSSQPAFGFGQSSSAGFGGFGGFGQSSAGFGGFGGFGQSSQTGFGFGQSSSAGFGGFGGFGASSSSPFGTFGQPAPAFGGFASSSAPAFGGFGAFGQPSSGGFGGFGGFGQSSSAPLFGGFGQTGGGFGFGQPAAPAFGGLGFGQSSSAGFGGFGGFGQSSSAGFGGFGGFGQSSAPTGFGLFGQPSSGGFGFGQPSSQGFGFGQPSSQGFGGFGGFGQSSSAGFGGFGFGQPSSAGFGGFGFSQPSSSNPFGFGAPSSSAGFGFGAFGQSSSANPFGGFGTSSGFGMSNPAFGGFGGFGASSSSPGLFGSSPFGAPQQPQPQPQSFSIPSATNFHQLPPQQQCQLIEMAYKGTPQNPACSFRKMVYCVWQEGDVARCLEMLKMLYTGISPAAWAQAMHANPDPKRLVPVPVSSFSEMHARVERQKERAELYAKTLSLLRKRVHAVEMAACRADGPILTKLDKLQVQHLELQHHLLMLMSKIQLRKQRGLMVRLEERELHSRLSLMQKELSQPNNFQGKLHELAPHVNSRLHHSALLYAPTVEDARALQDIVAFLHDQKRKLQVVSEVLKKDLRDMEFLTGKCTQKALPAPPPAAQRAAYSA